MADLSVLDLLLLIFALLPTLTAAQFFNFHDMFGQQQQRQQPQNVASDSNWYQQTYNDAQCDKYLCPHTLSCVHFPHHCPCAFPFTEEKIEFGEGSMLCASKGGYTKDETLKKVELARKGLL